ncbi:MAG TPA: sulfatase [Gemmatimonadaceae bacterium]
MAAPDTSDDRGERRPSLTSHARQVILFAAGATLLVSGVHLLTAWHAEMVRHQLTWAPRELWWMAPIGYGIQLMGIAAALVLLGVVLHRSRSRRFVVFVLGTYSALALLLLIPRLHPLAYAVLALGIGIQAARSLATTRPSRRRVAGAVTVVVYVLGMTTWMWGTAVRQTGMVSLQAPADRPSVLLIIWDTVRAANLSAYGYGRPTTPFLEQLAADGVLYESAFATAPWTLPSHASMFTGMPGSELSASWLTPLNEVFPTLAQVFHRLGWSTAGFVANHAYAQAGTGIERGFRRYEDFKRSLMQTLLTTTVLQTELAKQTAWAGTWSQRLRTLLAFQLRVMPIKLSDSKPASEVTDGFLRWSDTQDGPWFAFLNYFDAHLPYRSPERFRVFDERPGNEHLYDGAIAYLDSELQRLVTELRERGTLDNTIVVVTSDHGEQFGEHGLVDHGNSLYSQVLHVPLFILAPGLNPARISAPVSLRDLGATLLDLAGIGDSLPGTSLARIVDGPDSRAAVLLAEVQRGINRDPAEPVMRGDMASVITDSLHYIRNGDGVEELFRWRSDPGETGDLVAPDRADGLLRTMRAHLDSATRPASGIRRAGS